MDVTITVNGQEHTHDVEPRTLLVHYIREHVGLTGTNIGCDTSSCGACSIHLNGEAAKSCTVLAAQADGMEVTTIEGMAAADGTLHPMQQAFMENHGLQCGYCTPGMVMAATSLLDENPNPSEDEVRVGLEGNLCRCTGYHNIVKSVLAAAIRLSTPLDGGPAMTVIDNMQASEESIAAGNGVLGQRMLRKEDPALLTGEAVFTNDMKVPGALHLAVLRSPYAHAKIVSVDVAGALAIDGVLHAFSGADLADQWAAPMPCAWPVTDDMKNPAHYPLAVGKAAYVGDGVACVLATSDAIAHDALDAIDVEYEPLPAVIDLEAALSDDVVIHDELGTNVSYTWPLLIEENEGDCQKAMDTSAHVVKERYVQQRLIPMAMEPRAVVALPQPFGGDMTLYSSTQVPHILKVMTALTLGIPEQQMRVVCPAVGGGFGSKLNVYAEELLCVQLARTLKVPVRWNEERGENTQATCHGRAQIQDIELAADENGKITGLRVRLLGDMGAYLQLVTPGVPLLGAFLYGGVYEIPKAFDFSCTSVFTTMTPTDAYRGAGRPEATYAIEHAMDALARKIGLDPLELRRRNFIPKEAFPYEAYTGLVYDSGDHDKAATVAEELVDYAGMRARQSRTEHS